MIVSLHIDTFEHDEVGVTLTTDTTVQHLSDYEAATAAVEYSADPTVIARIAEAAAFAVSVNTTAVDRFEFHAAATAAQFAIVLIP